MSKCRNEAFLGKIKQNKLTKETEVTFAINEELNDCRRINANSNLQSPQDNGNGTYYRYRIPQNAVECEAPPCGNTGTLVIPEAIYVVQGEDWASGIITFYVTQPTTRVVVSISADQSFTDADTYTYIPIPAAATNGYNFVAVDLTDTPVAVGNGWTPGDVNYIKFELTGTEAGISSIAIFDSIQDFNINHVVKISCLSGIDGDTSIDAAEAECWDEGYDTSTAPTLERTVTCRLLTPNYWLLNPMLAKGKEVVGVEDVTITAQVAEGSGLALPGIASDGCSYVGVQVADPCNITDSMLERISLPYRVTLQDNQFQVIAGILYVATEMMEKDLIISYQKQVVAEELVASESNIGTRKVRMSYPYYTSDGVKYVKVFNNVLITSFPEGISNEEQEFEFTISIRRDAYGHYYKIYRVLGDYSGETVNK